MGPMLLTAWLAVAQPADAIAVVPVVPTFLDEYRVVCSHDRVSIARTKTGARSTLGVGNPRSDPGPPFLAHLAGDPALGAALGPALTSSETAHGGAIVYQIFDAGLLVRETASGTIWSHTHTPRNAGPRPANEIRRYPGIVHFRKEYDFAAYRERVELRQVATGRSVSIPLGAEKHEPSAPVQRALAQDAKLVERLGAALTAELPLFDGDVTLQAFVGGVFLREPTTGKTWYAWHAPRLYHGATRIALPPDPSAIVLLFDWRGGYTPPRTTNEPYLTIRADGLATLVDPFGRKPTVRARYTPAQLDDLLEFVVRKHRFFDLDTDRLADEARRGPRIMDVSTTVVRVSAVNRSHEVHCRGAVPYAEALPGAVSLQDFAAIERRLVREMDRLRPAN